MVDTPMRSAGAMATRGRMRRVGRWCRCNRCGIYRTTSRRGGKYFTPAAHSKSRLLRIAAAPETDGGNFPPISGST
jgi:hypothetical protein